MSGIDRRRLLGTVMSLGGAALSGTAFAQITSDAPPPVSEYARLPRITDTSLSPDAARIAFVRAENGRNMLVIYDIASETINRFDIAAGKIRGLRWAGPDHVLVLTSATYDLPAFWGRAREYSHAFLFDLRTRKVRLLFDGSQGYYKIITGDVQIVRDNGVYRILAPNYQLVTGAHNLWAFTLDEAAPKLFDLGDQESRDWVCTPTGRRIARSRYNNTARKWVLEMHDGKAWRSVYKHDEVIDYPTLCGLGRSDDTVIVFISMDEEGGQYFEIGRDGTLSAPLETKGLNARPLFHPVTGHFAGFSSADDWVVYDYSDEKLARMAGLVAKAFPGRHAHIVEFAEDTRKVLVYSEGRNDSGTYYFIDFASGNTIPVGQTYPQLPDAWVAEKQSLSYKAADGLEIHGYLTLPPKAALNGREAKNLPLIVLPHGGPAVRDRADFDWMSQALASRGYAVLQPNFRGSSGYGAAFLAAGYGEWGRKMQTDLSDGVRHLTRAGTVDPKRVAILGASYGGYAALAGVTLDAGIYNCAVAISGVSDLKVMQQYTVAQTGRYSTSQRYWERFMGDPGGYDDISPARQANKASVPVLLIHGDKDTVVPFEQSRIMEKALKAAGKSVELVILPEEDHWMSVESTRIDMINAAVGFLDRHNPA